MNINWKHIVLTALGAAIPVLFASLDASAHLSMATLGQSAATAGAVFWGTAIKGWLPSQTSPS